jgi:class 3 adenylate cyclase/tetratricopeptide (TPR) repeat protein
MRMYAAAVITKRSYFGGNSVSECGKRAGMETRTSFVFPPFRLELSSEQLWREDQTLALRPKTFAVLRYLVEHPGQLVTKDELLDAVWAGTVVSDTVLKSCIRELRVALDDAAESPQYITTVHRRGYRFIGQLSPLLGQTESSTETGHRQRVDEGRKVTRKLAAILSADVKGYSRLMGQDEVGTIRTLTTYRAVMTTLIAQHRGRVVDAPGDNMLAEFASAVDAVQCAVAIQQALGAKNAALPAAQQMTFRIGINVGDVVVEGERLYGEGVNIAARLEGLAEAGGLCISSTVYDQVKSKVALVYEALGERTVKNIAEPVRVYRVTWEAEGRVALSPATTSPVVSSRPAPPIPDARSPIPLLVGRDIELAQLHGWLEKALHGERQVVFVTGEPGIGKTTLVEAFLAKLEASGWGLETGPSPQASSLQPQVPRLWLGRGQCIEQYGAGEAYMPILEALGRLCREPGGERLIALLHQHAPTWLVQLPTLLNATELEALQRKVQGATRERMLREMGEAVEAITAERPLVLVLEDLHWSDHSTLELLSLLARRREPARLLVIGTYRPVDIIVSEHPLRTVKQELQLHGHCQELAVRLLTEAAVEEYLTVRLPSVPSPLAGEGQDGGALRQHQSPRPPHPAPLPQGERELSVARSFQKLAYTIHQRTEGNPLFMVTVVDELLTQEEIDRAAVEVSTPATIREMIEQQLERLSAEEQRVLEVASVAGMEFSAAAVAAGLETTSEEVEQRCTMLVRRGQFLQAKGTAEWPDGTVAMRYTFLHALYQEVTYERIPLGRRMSLHRRIGERIETTYGQRAKEIAAELAVHFERGRDYHKAVQYLQRAARNALHRSAHQEALTLLQTGLALIAKLPDSSDRDQLELNVQMMLTTPLSALRGFTDAAVAEACTRARALSERVGETPQLFFVLGGLCALSISRGELTTTHELATRCLRLAEGAQDPRLSLWAHYLLGVVYCQQGNYLSARAHLEQSLVLYDPRLRFNQFIHDPGPLGLVTLAWTLYVLGYPDQALEKIEATLTLARERSHSFTLAQTLSNASEFYEHRGAWPTAQKLKEECLTLSDRHGFSWWTAQGVFDHGRVLVRQGQKENGLALMRHALTTLQTKGEESVRPYHLYEFAEVCYHIGGSQEGLDMIEEALSLVRNRGQAHWESTLLTLRGELLLQQRKVERQKWKEEKQKPKSKRQKQGARGWGLETSSASPQASSLKPPVPSGVEQEAEGNFLKAIDIAQHQQAKSWELRASTSLARLWQQQGKRKEAHKLLAEIYNWFTEGFDTKDLQEAKALLGELSH